MTISPLKPSLNQPSAIQEAPKGKFQRFCDWTKAHKKEIAIAMLIIGIAALTFGVGAIIGLLVVCPVTPLSYLYGFFYSLFQFAPSGAVVGLTMKGSLLMAAIGSILGGTALTTCGKGMLAGIPKKQES